MSKLLSPCHPHIALRIIFVFAVILFYGHQSANAADLISGRYLSSGGTTVVLSLSIHKPSPANLIVEQYLSPGNSIAKTAPRAKKVDATQRKVKWLFRNTRSGKITLSIQLNEPLKGQVSAMVRYRDPRSGTFTELRISP